VKRKKDGFFDRDRRRSANDVTIYTNASTIRRSLRPLNSRRNFLESASHPGPLDRQNSEVSLAWLAQTYPRGLAAEALVAIDERLLA
jgi:hypothetical protein